MSPTNRRSSSFTAYAAAALCAAATIGAAGCAADAPGGAAWDAGTADAGVMRPDLPGRCSATASLPAPTVNPIAGPTQHAVQPFRGVALGASMIVAKGGAGTSAPVRVSTDGKFCLEVQLIEDAPNSVVFTALDAQGCPGPSTTITVQHQTSRGKSDSGVVPTSTEPTNIALNAPVKISQTPDDGGDPATLTDGDPKKGIKVTFWDVEANGACNNFVWVRLDFGKSFTVSKIRLRYPDDVGNDFAKCFSVLVARSANAGDPDPKNTKDWIVAHEEKNGTKEGKFVSFNPESAQAAAVLLYENDSPGLQETIRLGDIEIFGSDPNVVPAAAPDRCE